MAARLTTRQATKTRDAIQTGLLVNRLQDHAVGNIEMTTSQIRAAQILLNKTIPDLKAIEHSGDAENPVITKIEKHIVDPKEAG
jgi:hypothetical protein